MEPVRIGVIGCGAIGRQHAAIAADSPLLALVAVADLRAAAAQQVAREYNVPGCYGEAGALLRDPAVEAVVLALPAGGRFALAQQALAAGKHVLLEKPVAMNAAEVRTLLAARGDLIVGCCSSRMRGLPAAQAAAALVAEGRLGRLRLVRCRAVLGAGAPPQQPPPPWRLSKALNGGGILVNWGCYDLDFLLGIAGWRLRPRVVLAQTWNVPEVFAEYVAPGSDAETHVIALVLCDDGVVLSLERGEFAAGATDEAWQLLGDRGSVRLRMPAGHNKQVIFDEATPTGVVSHVIWRGDDPPGAEHRIVLEDFAQAVRMRRAPRTTLEQALVIQELTDAIYASAAQGAPVMLADPALREPTSEGG
jgi:UDP-N-acetyl-2-amino-2-deoxyglucuronate dehydrogenase